MKSSAEVSETRPESAAEADTTLLSAAANLSLSPSQDISANTTEDILSRLKTIRERLLSLRKAPASGSKEMSRLWKEVSLIVKGVAVSRSHSDDTSSYSAETPESIMEDIAPMFLQFWSLRGKIAENMYPVYVKLAKYKHTMEQLLETGLFTKSILKDLDHHIMAAEAAVNGFKNAARTSTASPTITKSASGRISEASSRSAAEKNLGPGYSLLEAKLLSCQLKISIRNISPFLLPVHTRLVEIKHDLEQLISRRNAHAFSLAEVQMLQDELLEIDSVRIDGSFLGKDGSVLPGQATVIWLLEQCYDDVHELLALREAISGDNPLRPVYESLIRLKTRLDELELMFRYTIKWDELVPVQIELGSIDNLRVDGKFVDAEGNIPEGQAVLHFLLHKCYRTVYKIQSMTEPVADALMPVYNHLMTLRKCFLELQRWRVPLTMRDLTLYQVKLAKLDNQRVDGKFCAEDGSIPEGQGILHDLLDQCYSLQTELLLASEDTGDEEEDEEEGEEEENAQ
ncbi:hypothetical protein HK100_004256 [Physocladia obscura]|uniref:Uncharacterized protein n=1 Tax=Physocladia obscura TaxID=109957 RepID=A0AAD5XDY7_9FUNG|nr:hypothetical protein HK100_004256 [Physocladia obscura]